MLPEEPQTGFGKKTLAQACMELGLEQIVIIDGLNEMGITAAPDMVIKEIATGAGKEPRDVYQAIRTIAGGEMPSAK